MILKKKRRLKVKNVVLASIIAVVLLTLISTITYRFVFYSPIRKKVVVEASDDFALSVDLFVKDASVVENFTLSTANEQLVDFAVGEYEIIIEYETKSYTSKLTVTDTMAPTADVLEGYVSLNTTIAPEKLVENIQDFSDVIVSFSQTYSFTETKDYTVELILEDVAGNMTTYQTIVHCIDDVEAPVFTAVPALYLTPYQTDYDVLSGISVTDNTASDITITTENADIDTTYIGEHYVTIRATDTVGNEAVTERLIVVAPDKVVATMNAFATTSADNNAAIDAILAEIITDDMSERQEMAAIYDWVLANISYRSDANEAYLTDPYAYVDEYLSLTFKRDAGHCFHFAVIAGKLLQQRGYEIALVQGDGHNVDGSFSLHFWIKVKYNDTWYHFDPLFEELYYYQLEFFLSSDYELYGVTHIWDDEYDF